MRRQAAYGIAYITPGMFIVLAFCILPIFMTLYYSFTSYNLAQEPKFVFLDNYQKLFRTPSCARRCGTRSSTSS